MKYDALTLIAASLLFLRLVSVVFMAMVIRRQYRLFSTPVEPDAERVRQVLFIFAIVIMCGQFVPILIDTNTLVTNVPNGSLPSTLLVAYAYSNAITATMSSVLFWLIYRSIASQNAREKR